MPSIYFQLNVWLCTSEKSRVKIVKQDRKEKKMRQSEVREVKVKFSIIVWEYLFWQVFADLCDVQYSVKKVVKFLPQGLKIKSIQFIYFFLLRILSNIK